MSKRRRVFDRYGREVDVGDDDDYVVEDGGYVRLSSIMFMDKRAPPAPPPGQYFLHDGAGNVAGVASLDGAAKVAAAREDYVARLSNGYKAHRLTPMTDVATPPRVPEGFKCPSCGYSAPQAASAAPDPRMAAYGAYKRRLEAAHRGHA